MAHQNFTGLTLHQNNKIPRLAEFLSNGEFYCKVSGFFVCLFGKLCKYTPVRDKCFSFLTNDISR